MRVTVHFEFLPSCESERKHHLQINTPVRRLRIEYASCQRGGLAEQVRAEVSHGRSRINVVEHVARIGAEGKAITLVRFLSAAHRTAASTRPPYSSRATGASATRTSPSFSMVTVTLSLLRIGIGSFKFGTDANRLAQA